MLADRRSAADAEPPTPPARRPARATTLRVLKFGGTSVGDAARLERVASLVESAVAEERVVVVLSAMSGVTDLLFGACDRAAAGDPATPLAEYRERHDAVVAGLDAPLGEKGRALLGARLAALDAELERSLSGIALLGDASPRVRAQVAALGERASVELMAALLEARGHAVERLDSRRLLPCEGGPLEARPRVDEARERLAPFVASGAPLAVAPGFFGGDAEGRALLLGRGGSDYSAALFAQALDARRLEIWTDVAGICTADPRVVPAARPVREASFEEAIELAHFGAKVLHPKSVAPARAAGIPVRVASTLAPEDPGTLVRPGGAAPERIACGLTLLDGVALLSLASNGSTSLTHLAARAFAALAERGIEVILVSHGSSESALHLGLKNGEADRAENALAEVFAAEIATGRVEPLARQSGLAVLSLVGDGMRRRTGVSGRLFGALGAADVNVVAIAQGASERSICAVVESAQGASALRAVHARFFEATEVDPPARPATRDVAPGPGAEDGVGPRRAGATVAAFAPASIGNLAAGFDLLGAAIEPVDGEAWGDVVLASISETSEIAEVAEVAGADALRLSGPYAARLPDDPAENVVTRARDAFAKRCGGALPPLELELVKGLPVASGLGGSAASAVATVVALDHLLGTGLAEEELLAAAAEAEGHSAGAAHLDNVAPILSGGVRLVAFGEKVRELPWPEALRFVLVVPELELATRAARAVLPAEVPLPLAIAHSQNLAALVHALHAGDRELLGATLRDLLAEPHRAGLVRGFAEAKAAALAAGALGCSLSGAGPSLFAVADPRSPRASAPPRSPPGATLASSPAPASARAAPGARIVDPRAFAPTPTGGHEEASS
ncbi:MAG: homoserine kinase [Holophagales bacterium]|nr:homoserine kinase [Holophagales bacterium]